MVADGQGDEVIDEIHVVDSGASDGRRQRILQATRRVFRNAVRLDADLYHLHDPELIPFGLRLKKMGKRVIFDAHEDFAKQMQSKRYLGPIRRKIIAEAFSFFERFACKRLDGIVTATPTIRDKFLTINPNTVDINNYPLLDELVADIPWHKRVSEVCYLGGITSVRGIREIVAAMHVAQSSVRLNLMGKFSEPEIEAEVKKMPGWQRVNDMGFLDRSSVRDVLGRSMAGLVTFHALPNHTDAQPNKMFEYMSAGLPVIASDFSLWSEIVEGNACGICVDPLDPAAIAQAIDDLIADRTTAQYMGENGRRAVTNRYNWQAEEKKLLDFYSSLLQSNSK